MLVSYPAHAWAPPPQKTTDKAKDDGGGKAAGKGQGKRKGKKRMTLDDEFLIEGKLEKPSAFYILRKSSLDYDWARLDARFTPLVLESVQDPLF